MIVCLALASWTCTSTARAQRDVVEDGWAEAEAAMDGDAPAHRATLSEFEPVAPGARSPWLGAGRMGPGRRARRRAARRARRAAARAAREHHLQALRSQAARARTPFGGPLRIDLRGARGLDWVWLGQGADASLFPRAPSLCVGECVLHLPAGRYRLGVRDANLQGAVARSVEIGDHGVLTAHYQSRREWRRGGIGMMVFGGATVLGFLLRAMITAMRACGLYGDESSSCTSPTPLDVKIGIPLGFAFFFGGLTFVLTSHRRVRLEFHARPHVVEPAW